ncbi:MAG TPA: response regulator [Candidatus Synoicihabitans sp.]|nr:response regulator [Candidatus Synoicihabitans sp.]
MSSLRPILLVEDNELDVELSTSALREANIANDIVVARDGVEALDYLFRRGPHENRTGGDPAVVFLDLKMPRVDGQEVLREIRRKPSLQLLPVVVLTSSREEQDLLKIYNLGANAYVVKPVDFEKFVNTVSKLGFFWAVLNEPPPAHAVTANSLQ